MRLTGAALLLLSLASMVLAAEEPSTTIRLQLAGSSAYGNAADAPVRDAALFVDTTTFDGKSGFVRLQKGMTAAYLVISSREIGCETTGAFEKTPFLQHNVTPMPKLPELSSDSDFVVMVGCIDLFDPRKQATSTLLQALTKTPITKLTSTAFSFSSVDVPWLKVDEIDMHVADVGARSPSAREKVYGNHPPWFRSGGTVIGVSKDGTSLHLQSRRETPPWDPAPVVLRGEGDHWTAAIDLNGKEMNVRGVVPLRMCTPVSRTVNEYAEKK